MSETARRDPLGTDSPWKAGTVYQVTDNRLTVLGRGYRDLTAGTHLIVWEVTDGSWVLLGYNTRTGERVWLRGEQWVLDHFREIGPVATAEVTDVDGCTCGVDAAPCAL